MIKFALDGVTKPLQSTLPSKTTTLAVTHKKTSKSLMILITIYYFVQVKDGH